MHVYLLRTTLGGQFHHGRQMLLMTVHAAWRQETHNVYRATRADGPINGDTNSLVGKEVTVIDRLGNPGKILIDHPSSAQIHVTNFRITHLPIRQPHIHARTGNQRVWRVSPQPIPYRCIGSHDGIGFRRLAVTEAIQNHEDYGLWGCCHTE